MKHVPIAGKFLAILGVFGLFTLAAILFSAQQNARIKGGYERIAQGADQGTLLMARANGSLGAMKADILQMIVDSSGEGVTQAAYQLQQDQAAFDAAMTAAMVHAPGLAGDLGKLQASGDRLVSDGCAKTVSLAQGVGDGSAKPGEALPEYLGGCSLMFPFLQKSVADLGNGIAAEGHSAIGVFSRRVARESLLLYGGLIGMLLLIGILGFLGVRRWIVTPLRRLAAVMGRLADGEYMAEVPARGQRDEIGAMARTVEIFKAAGLDRLRLESDAAAARVEAAADRARLDAERDAAARAQALVVGDLARGLAELSRGDLRYRLERAFSADYEALRTDFNAAMGKLDQALAGISATTGAVRGVAGEIARASEELARRTEMQAASLTETVSALDAVTGTTRKTAENARLARNAAASARGDAEQSGIVLRDTVRAMDAIQSSSREIGNIVSLIDEIAFQTNLLALNAGVEAARAGEAGRGFAVVAVEVRALAQRSADAAREIKTLISASGVGVESGVTLVGRTAQTLESISDQVATLNRLIEEIAASAQEQADGLGQVSQAMGQMDQVTQQNSAMVESSATLSRRLSAEAERLSAMVGDFDIFDEPAATPAFAPRGRLDA
jgi:methyl-accepting chemotaxis protein